ncbi:hypothetical protein ASPZODRAFT_133756 [Penicilliopsis zonata CBS 506.65]|uniref:Major facilitator superfamily (MFS) profile domain-containing protein n=1 Tax=Penicilliopsis zonata CBS 506.65 TaxID=1073090 RepID=A0A1L9SFA6_9EURO|nr:hypothetical protein ASPZODRAFT_133756 [Penicilliopsis zonata CBS 506.65]OJJ45881.1 hypothetical protein ASPZODRAFT_133756 [Penicilliopsis zonata CBS 506.65]
MAESPSTESKVLSPEEAAVEEPTRLARPRWLLICAGIFSANLMYGLDTTIAADIQADVAATFDNVAQLGWLGVGFTLGSTVAILPLGKAFALFNTKWLYFGCLCMFAAGSALCGAAPSMNAMIVGRVWAGAGGAGMYLGTLNLVTILTSEKDQPFYVSLIGFTYGTGCILGPVVGGLLADSPATWRWAFYLNLVIFGVLSPAYVLVLPSLPRRSEASLVEKLASLDWLGTLLTAVVYVSFTLALTLGGTSWAWRGGAVVALFVVFGVTLLAFCLTQAYAVGTNPVDRLFPCEFLRHPRLVLLYLCMASGGAALFVSTYYIPLYFTFVAGDSGTQAAVRLLPFICCFVVTVLLCGAFMDRLRRFPPRAWYLACGILMTAGGAGMYTVTQNTPPARIYGFSVLLGLGMATTQAGYALAPRLVRPERVAEAIQFMNIAQGSSQLIGLAVASCIFQTVGFAGLTRVLAHTGYTHADIRAALVGARSEILQTVSAGLKVECLQVIVDTIDDVWVMVIAAGGFWTVCSLFL